MKGAAPPPPPPAAASPSLGGGEALALARSRAAAAAAAWPFPAMENPLPKFDPPPEDDECHSGRMCTSSGDGGRRHHSAGRTGDCGGMRVGSLPPAAAPGDALFRFVAGAIQRWPPPTAAAAAAFERPGWPLPGFDDGGDSLSPSRDTWSAELWLPGGARGGEDPRPAAGACTTAAGISLCAIAGESKPPGLSLSFHPLPLLRSQSSYSGRPGACCFS